MAPLHGAYAFKNFISKNKHSNRVPKLIQELDQWHNEQQQKQQQDSQQSLSTSRLLKENNN